MLDCAWLGTKGRQREWRLITETNRNPAAVTVKMLPGEFVSFFFLSFECSNPPACPLSQSCPKVLPSCVLSSSSLHSFFSTSVLTGPSFPPLYPFNHNPSSYPPPAFSIYKCQPAPFFPSTISTVRSIIFTGQSRRNAVYWHRYTACVGHLSLTSSIFQQIRSKAKKKKSNKTLWGDSWILLYEILSEFSIQNVWSRFGRSFQQQITDDIPSTLTHP